MLCVRAQCCFVLAALAVLPAAAQSGSASRGAAVEVRSVHVFAGDDGAVLEIVSTRPLTPKLQTVENPLRLVIDLPGSTLGSARHKIPFRNEQIISVRVNQYQSDPAVTRVVVDLAAPVRYTWDAMGSRLRIRVHADAAAVAKPPSVPAFTAGVQPVAVPVAVGSSGTLVEAGSRVASGASIIAGGETAVLRLTRGGEVRVCPGTTVSVATSPNGQDIMLGMSKGAMETHYALQESIDSVLTPDFRIVLPGPGEFNLAISSDAHGNTCVGSLPGSTSSAVVAELIGSGTYEVRPDQQVLFRQGRLDTVEKPVASCGCPPSEEPVLRTSVDPSAAIPLEKAGDKLQLDNSADNTTNSAGAPSTSPLPESAPGSRPEKSKAQVEMPLVFSGSEIAKARGKGPVAGLPESGALPLTAKVADPLPAVVVLPPVADPKPASRGFFGKVKGFFGSIFR